LIAETRDKLMASERALSKRRAAVGCLNFAGKVSTAWPGMWHVPGRKQPPEANALTSAESVSRAIMRLERELGLTLLQRTTRKLTLTRAGERYLVSAREALGVLYEAHAELINADGAPRGTVRMTAPVDPATRVGGVVANAIAAANAGHRAAWPT
jgi:hypothetical protein